MPKAFDSWKVLPHDPLNKLSERLWDVQGALPNMSLRRRMTLVRLDDGRLVVHNPVALAEAAMGEIEAWGTPAWILVPAAWHRLDSANYKRRYPDAQVLCPAGARKAVEQAVAVDGTYDEFERHSGVAIEHLDGVAEREGVVKVEDGNRSALIFNDTVFNQPHLPGVFGFVYRLMGSSGGPRVTRIAKLAIVKERRALRAHLERLAEMRGLQWVVPGHGELIVEDAAEVLRTIAAAL